MKTRYVVMAVVGAVAATVVIAVRNRSAGANGYLSAKIEKGNVVETVKASGVVRPLRLVKVGTQVNGPVKKLNVDFNDMVKAGDIVAQIDPATYEARVAQDEASLKQSAASLEQSRAKLALAESDLRRIEELAGRDLVSKSERDAAVANRDVLAAQVRLSEATVEQSGASLRLSRANLDYTTIRSPVDGIVVDRSVDEGQTVVASMSAQTLFVIATDLSELQIEASIPEADIGRIRAGQPVTFTVDAFEETFTGMVSQVRLAANTVQNVVTYPVIVRAANRNAKLFPGMTANITCETERRNDTLKVPNAALRFRMSEAKAEPAAGRGGQGGQASAGRTRGPRLWLLAGADGKPEQVEVRTGISDGAFTSVEGQPELAEGREVITGLADPAAAKQAQREVSNPFMPRMPQGPRRTR